MKIVETEFQSSFLKFKLNNSTQMVVSMFLNVENVLKRGFCTNREKFTSKLICIPMLKLQILRGKNYT